MEPETVQELMEIQSALEEQKESSCHPDSSLLDRVPHTCVCCMFFLEGGAWGLHCACVCVFGVFGLRVGRVGP